MKSETDLLNEKIISLENRKAHELKLLKEHFYFVHEELKPVNLIKNTLHEVFSSPELKHNVMGNAIGLATGYLSKKILFGASNNPLKRILGSAMQFVIANTVSKHSDKIKDVGQNLLIRILKHIKQPSENDLNGESLFL